MHVVMLTQKSLLSFLFACKTNLNMNKKIYMNVGTFLLSRNSIVQIIEMTGFLSKNFTEQQ